MPSTTNGVIWSAVERFSVQGVQFLLTLVIARLVTPGEYGLIAMLSIFMAIAQSFIDSGFGTALIQKKDRSEIDFSTVFFFNIGVSLLLYAVLFLCAPLIADFYNEPSLTDVTRVVGINLVVMSLSLVQRTRLSIDLNFKLQSKISLAAVIISGVIGIVTAYHGWGVWALVTQTLANNTIQTILFWSLTKWHPAFAFSMNSFRPMFAFGSKLLASGLLHTIYLNLYTLVIGKFYNAADVGYYNRAYTISQYVSTNMVTVFTRAIYPAQCKNQDDDNWLCESFIRYLRMACFIIFPLMGLLVVIAKPLVLLILTEKWLPAAQLMSILSIAYMWFPVMVINNQMLNVKGRSDLFLKAEIIKKIIALGILIATLPFGLVCLCWGILIYNLFDMWLIIWFVRVILPLGYRIQAKALYKIFLLTLAASFVSYISISLANTWAEIGMPQSYQIMCGVFFFGLVFIMGSKLLDLPEINMITHLISKIKN